MLSCHPSIRDISFLGRGPVPSLWSLWRAFKGKRKQGRWGTTPNPSPGILDSAVPLNHGPYPLKEDSRRQPCCRHQPHPIFSLCFETGYHQVALAWFESLRLSVPSSWGARVAIRPSFSIRSYREVMGCHGMWGCVLSMVQLPSPGRLGTMSWTPVAPTVPLPKLKRKMKSEDEQAYVKACRVPTCSWSIGAQKTVL